MYIPNGFGSRFCNRCGMPLTDAASLNEGIGPICRKLDNALLARLIPSDLNKAREAYRAVDVLGLVPETAPTFLELEAALLDPNASNRDDWRKEVKRVEWILSHGQNAQNIKALKTLVLALGYVGIVSLWNGEATTGKASVWFDGGRLYVKGPKNKAARIALKLIPGWKFHPSDPNVNGSKASWSVPAAKSEAFYNAIVAHYPNFEGLHEAVKAAQAHTEAQAASSSTAPAVPVQPKMVGVSLTEADGILKVQTPYHVCFIATLKALPYQTRKWNAAEKVWEVQASYRSQVEAMLHKFFPNSIAA